MPPFPPPRTAKVHTELGKLTDAGFVETDRGSECWFCGKTSHKVKPGAQNNLWRCECGTEWVTKVSET